MRSIFSLRFLAAIGATIALFALLLVATDDGVDSTADGSVPASTAPGAPSASTPAEPSAGGSNPAPSTVASDAVDAPVRQVDFVEAIESMSNANFRVRNGAAANDTTVVIDDERRLEIMSGTPGERYCNVDRARSGCAIVADLLGDAVVWFAIVPGGGGRAVNLPAIDELVDGRAILVNGWSLRYAPILDRRCVADDDPSTQDEFLSYAEFRDVLGDNFIATYDIEAGELTSVTCRQRSQWYVDSLATTRAG